MIAVISWFRENPLEFMFMIWGIGVANGIMIGRASKTRHVEFERDRAREDLNTLRDAIEIVQKK